MDFTVLSILQKAVTFDDNFAIKNNFLAFLMKYFFVGKYILNDKSKTNKPGSLKIVWLQTKVRQISNRRNQMPLTLFSPADLSPTPRIIK